MITVCSRVSYNLEELATLWDDCSCRGFNVNALIKKSEHNELALEFCISIVDIPAQTFCSSK